jgi:hypothetical protein
MPNKRQILQCLSRSALIEIARIFEIAGMTGKTKDDILDGLKSKRSISIQDILSQLSRDELKGICESLGFDGSGKEKNLLINRICGDEPEPEKLSKDSMAKAGNSDKEHTLTTQSNNRLAP